MYNSDNASDLNEKALSFFSIFIFLACILFIFLHSFAMYFYSASYREYRCTEAKNKFEIVTKQTIKQRALLAIRTNLQPNENDEEVVEDEYLKAKIRVSYENSNFKVQDDDFGSYALFGYRFKMTGKYEGKNFCSEFIDSKEKVEFFNVVQLPLSQWLLYNASQNNLRFASEITGIYPGRIFSEGNIVLNYKLDPSVINDKFRLGEYDKNPSTLFTNFNSVGKFVGGGLVSRGVIKLQSHIRDNNINYIKKFEKYQPYQSIFDIEPNRIVSDIINENDKKFFGNYVVVNQEKKDIHSEFNYFDYDKWIKKSLSDGNVKLKQMSLLRIRIRKNGVNFYQRDSRNRVYEERMQSPSWLKYGKKIVFDVGMFLKWYQNKFSMRIPIINRTIFSHKALVAYIKNESPKSVIVLKNTSEISLRSFMIFNSRVVLSDQVNESNIPLFIMAKNFELRPADRTLKKMVINSVLISQGSPTTFHDYFTIRKNLSNLELDFNGSFVSLNGKYKHVNNRSFLPKMKLSWNYRLLAEKFWMNFVPSKYYLME